MRKIEFVPAKHAALVAKFSCGVTPWALEVSEWLKAPETTLESASRMLKRKLVEKVWLFFEEDDTLVGFTSIKKDTWHIEERGNKCQIVYLPYIGVSTEYQGKKEPAQQKSYFKILFEDFLYEAKTRATMKRDLCALHVQKSNEKAIGIYTSYGFRASGEEPGGEGIVYLRMIADLLHDRRDQEHKPTTS